MDVTDKYQRSISGEIDESSKKKFSNDRRRKKYVKKLDEDYKEAIEEAAKTDFLLQEDQGLLEADGMEKTYKFKQDDIAQAVDISMANKRFKLNLPDFGPYTLDYTRNGRDLIIGGKKGHVAAFDWRLGKLHCELNLNETVHDVKFLHNNQFFATAQKKYVYIYDKDGTEIHKLKHHKDQTLLEFLPYHFLLASAGNSAMLKYTDTSTGQLVSELSTKHGPTTCMNHNPWNAVIHLGHSHGQVTLWSPKMSKPLVKLQSSNGPVKSIAINRGGNYMAVASADKTIKIWDIRKFEEIDSYFTPTQPSSLDISDTGLLSVTWGPHVTIWKDVFKSHQKDPYMSHLIPSTQIQRAKFVPFEDILGIGHNYGFESMIVPGSGESNYDAMELNPFETSKMRKESEIRMLMNKLKPEMITLDPHVIGNLDKRKPQERLTPKEQQDIFANDPNNKKEQVEKLIKPFVKPKNSTLRAFKRKQRQNLITERALRVEKALQKEKELRAQMKEWEANGGEQPAEQPLDSALSRFK
ncbi:Utp7 protein [Martiniozyma asiatica (nom. inval.)]|nr:Utp7 protein [Martiniozyma asiatica]